MFTPVHESREKQYCPCRGVGDKDLAEVFGAPRQPIRIAPLLHVTCNSAQTPSLSKRLLTKRSLTAMIVGVGVPAATARGREREEEDQEEDRRSF